MTRTTTNEKKIKEYPCSVATFSPQSHSTAIPTLSAPLVSPPPADLVLCNSGRGRGGGGVAPGGTYAGKIVIVLRGQCTFEEKVGDHVSSCLIYRLSLPCANAPPMDTLALSALLSFILLPFFSHRLPPVSLFFSCFLRITRNKKT